MKREDRHDDVDATTGELWGAERSQVHGGVVSHPETMGAHQPGTMVATRDARDPGVHLLIGFVLHPPDPTGLQGVGRPSAREGGVLEVEPRPVLVPYLDVVGRRWVTVIPHRSV